MCCYLTRTTKSTHQLIKENLHETPTYGGWVEAKGPRYCPSIEDKVRLIVYVITFSCIKNSCFIIPHFRCSFHVLTYLLKKKNDWQLQLLWNRTLYLCIFLWLSTDKYPFQLSLLLCIYCIWYFVRYIVFN